MSLVRKFKIWFKEFTVSDIYILIKICAINQFRKGEAKENYFGGHGQTFPRFGPHQYLITMILPKSMEKEVRFHQDGQSVTYCDDDSD